MARVVALFVYNGALALDVAGPAEVFATANRLSASKAAEYEVRVVSKDGGIIVTASGIPFLTEKASSLEEVDTFIVSGGPRIKAVATDPEVASLMRRAAAQSRRMCSVCTGAFVLAEAGLLEGRRAVTHWETGEQFRARFPGVKLDLEPIYIRDGAIWTSAGVTAGIDLALALTEDDLGRSMAIGIAKQLVVFLHRPGGQAQFSATLSAQTKAAGREAAERFRKLHSWMAENLAGELSVPTLAAQVNMAPRSFARTYAEAMGVTPAKAVEDLRLEAAKGALEAGEAPLKVIAVQCGFGNEERLRRSFSRRYGVAPSAYRDCFGPGRDDSAMPADPTAAPPRAAAR
ncbi:MAG TPA: DJ-1/PfpI family protein [Caulobacteraceae bacterium]|nr:DJ-1/PfpI family protein [Caulobacteraceae bacterium]